MDRRALLGGGLAAGALAIAGGAWWASRRRPRPKGPNVVVILTDDQGLNDLGCYYTPPDDAAYAAIDTPNLDALAATGLRHTKFYVGAAVCTPSRAALLTGCFPPRVGFGAKGPGPGVLTPTSREGLNPDETTLAELFRAAGYHTGCVGKWHLGHLEPFRPTRQGFDEFFGIPWSNNQAPLSLIRDESRVRGLRADEPLVGPFTQEAAEFVARCGDERFFLYLAYSAPHEPWAVSPSFRGSSRRGTYGDAITEIDASVGRLVALLGERGLLEDTLIVFLSDNGPWLHPTTAGGSAFPLRGGKGDSFEGGFRSPCLVSWPGTLPAGRDVAGLASSVDLLPTLAAACGLPLPERPIDGLDLSATWAGGDSPRGAMPYYARGRLEAITDGRWKRMYAVPVRNPPVPAALFDLSSDPAELRDLSAIEPAQGKRLDAIADGFRERLGDVLSGREGTENRDVGTA